MRVDTALWFGLLGVLHSGCGARSPLDVTDPGDVGITMGAALSDVTRNIVVPDATRDVQVAPDLP